MRLLLRLLVGAAALVAVLAAGAGLAYAMDMPVEATVVRKSEPCKLVGSNSVTVQAKLLGIEHTVTGLEREPCLAVNSGNFVKYHIRSGRTSLWVREGGPCIYDSVDGVGGCP
jgi:hypothetical protein